ncbi:molybdenum cofactor biosysynthesis protein : MOSC domain protein OS=Carboxydothermus hydrogenoformans (strain Z-2901 / DSM 6008) GN=CHY_0804 PE=4 SV=1: MOSC [Gemmata massiliana]|uniref:MOSC domain-containing protein n=1 Tax=Gemmata massiliana TaxID=1210884 RepID=A0A6P2CYU6_9BACT|nr:MOSC domain-containing protein [Gemmata massiliana]VTR92380.1 molybdenum cofactor biosysynthesis protein : MOSC domain protein OS=Carboxydothermus hydrogenoformans (strain Z-2901 / DSM 6008) GN=CHY_0804 PE=4 SV=1: MOSC [Gemmata massiliana]
MAHVASIVYRPKNTGRPQDRYERVPADRVRLVEFRGIEGDMKGSSTSRQLNVMCAETLAELGAEGFQVAPGEMGEQIVLAGLDPAALAEGTHIKLGESVIKVGILRTGCARFEMIQGKARELAKGRLGVLATVVAGGEVAVGDMVEVLAATT